MISVNRTGSDLDGDIHTGWKIELFELLHSARGGFHNVQETLVGTDFELVGRFLINMDRAVHRELLDTSRQRNRSGDFCTSALSGLDDLRSRTVDSAAIKGTETDADFGLCMNVRYV